MFRKMVLLGLALVISVYSYTGALHAKFIEVTPGYLRAAGFPAEADTVKTYLKLMMIGAQSPDKDYPDLVIPNEMLPDWLKSIASGKSIGKWEHTLVDDLPKEVEDLLKKIAALKGIEFNFADKTIVKWIEIAESYWSAGQIDSAMWHLSRACHLIQDINVPMHCRITGNLADVWQVMNHTEPNHEKFEKYCTKNFVLGGKTVDLTKEFKLPDVTYEIAADSRKILKFCDGIGPGCIFNFPPFSFLPWFVEDYDKAMNISATRGEIYTVQLIHYFFQRVK